MARLSLLDRIRQSRTPERQIATLDDYAQAISQFTYNGVAYQTGGLQTTLGNNGEESIPNSFEAYSDAHNSHPVLFACIATRQLVFSEARFQWRRFDKGRPGDLFGDQSLQILEEPWKNGTTGELLARMEQDTSLCGNFFATVRGGELRRLRPDWVTIVRGGQGDSDSELDTDLVGYAYTPGGFGSGNDTELLPTIDVVHYSPYPDPLARWRGMSWVTPIARELTSHRAATAHKLKFFENGATPNLVVSLAKEVDPKEFDRFVEQMDDQHKGLANAYKTLYLGGGADATIVGNNFEQMNFTSVQGASESLVAAAAGVPPVLAGFSEGLQAATYSNYAQARRRFVDGTIRPLWRTAAAALEKILRRPGGGTHLWYDDRDIPFLREDLKDEAEIEKIKAASIRQLIDGGYEPSSVVAAVSAGDMNKLVHTGLVSVQLLPPGTTGEPPVVDDDRSLRVIRDDDGFISEVKGGV